LPRVLAGVLRGVPRTRFVLQLLPVRRKARRTGDLELRLQQSERPGGVLHPSALDGVRRERARGEGTGADGRTRGNGRAATADPADEITRSVHRIRGVPDVRAVGPTEARSGDRAHGGRGIAPD